MQREGVFTEVSNTKYRNAFSSLLFLYLIVLLFAKPVMAEPVYTLETNQWHQLVLPGESGGSDLNSIFSGQLPLDQYNVSWVVYLWDNRKAAYVNPGLRGRISTGQGFWLIQLTGEAVTLNAGKLPAAPTVPSRACPIDSGCTEVSHFSGESQSLFGMIGSAQRVDQTIETMTVVSADIDGVCAQGCSHTAAAEAGLVNSSILRFNPAAEKYDDINDIGILEPWQGAWFQKSNAELNSPISYLFYDRNSHPPTDPNLESLRNTNPLFRQHETLSSADLTGLGFFHDGFTEPASRPDNGPSPQGQFRIGCQYSHFGYNDPIIKPGQPNKSHLHMFWGNTTTDAFTRYSEQSALGDPNDIMERGGATCQGFELNRSAYWVPALLTNRESPRSVVVPDNIVIYYKSHRPQEVNPLPAGIQFLAGNVGPNAEVGESFSPNHRLYWSCGKSGVIRKTSGRIPTDCASDEYINATIAFPQCIAVDGNGKPVLSSPDFISHTRLISNNDQCPSSHPYRVPQISYLLYYPNGTDGAGAGVANWVLSSDKSIPGGSLHGDWLGGWHDQAMQKWIDGCHDPKQIFAGPRNCSIGQTGQNGTNRQFRRVSRLNDYEGPNFLQLD